MHGDIIQVVRAGCLSVDDSTNGQIVSLERHQQRSTLLQNGSGQLLDFTMPTTHAVTCKINTGTW